MRRVPPFFGSAAQPAFTMIPLLSAVVMLYGAIVIYNVATEQIPSGVTGIFAPPTTAAH